MQLLKPPSLSGKDTRQKRRLISGALVGLFAVVGTVYIVSSQANVQPVGMTGTWNLAFSDEFNDTRLDPAKWTDHSPWQANGYGAGDEGWVFVPTPQTNLQESNGSVKLKMRRQSGLPSGKTHSTSEISTAKKWAIPAGVTSYTEARMKAPSNKGSLPAFWLLGEDGQWPIYGEIDILEFANNATEGNNPYFSVWFAKDVYTKPPGTWMNGIHDTHPDSKAPRPDLKNTWHVWGLYRSPEKMELRIDGKLIATFKPNTVYPGPWYSSSGMPIPPVLFTSAQHIRFSYGVGGAWQGAGLTNAQYEDGDFEIDYVRSWIGNGTGTTTPPPPPPPADATLKINQAGNLLSGRTFTASVGAQANQPVSYVNDKNESTRWVSQPADNVTLSTDLGSEKALDKVSILWAGDTAKNYEVQISKDNTTWKSLATGLTNNTTPQLIEHAVSPTNTGRYLRVLMKDRHNLAYGNSIWEIAAYGKDAPVVVVDPAPGVKVPFRANIGGGTFSDATGALWNSEAFIGGSGGGTNATTSAIAGTTNQKLYQTERWCAAPYSIPVANGAYKLRLHFAEINPTSGTRVFGVTAEGVSILSNFNIAAEAGAPYKALVKEFPVKVADGKLDLAFTRVSNCPSVSGLEILPASSTPPVAKPGDLNGDGAVGITDLSVLLSKWGSADPVADLNKDGSVGITDLSLLLSKWGS